MATTYKFTGMIHMVVRDQQFSALVRWAEGYDLPIFSKIVKALNWKTINRNQELKVSTEGLKVRAAQMIMAKRSFGEGESVERMTEEEITKVFGQPKVKLTEGMIEELRAQLVKKEDDQKNLLEALRGLCEGKAKTVKKDAILEIIG